MYGMLSNNAMLHNQQPIGILPQSGLNRRMTPEQLEAQRQAREAHTLAQQPPAPAPAPAPMNRGYGYQGQYAPGGGISPGSPVGQIGPGRHNWSEDANGNGIPDWRENNPYFKQQNQQIQQIQQPQPLPKLPPLQVPMVKPPGYQQRKPQQQHYGGDTGYNFMKFGY